jgi:AraC-like DNA-binding protein
MAGRLSARRHTLERAIEEYLQRCYRSRSPARVSELADLLGASRAYLSTAGTAILGVRLNQALRLRQLAYAARLLRETDLSIAEIATAAAFGTERSFYRTFRRHYGTTPAAYRENPDKLSVDALP